MGTDVRRTDTMFIAPQRSCSGLQWSKTEWCVYLYSNCRKWPQVLQECDIITFGWFNCWRQHLHPDTVLYHTSRHNLLHVSLSACWKTGQNPCKNTHGENCMAQVGCWYFVRLCGAAGGEVSDKKTIQTHPYSNCTFHHQNSQRKQTSFTVPTNLGKTLANIIYCMCLFQHVGKQDRTHVRTHMMKIALRKLVAGILCGCVVLLVDCEVSEGKKTIQTYPYSNCTFHHQSSQRKQTSFTVPTNLEKTLANIIHCMCFFQHNGKQNRTHARTNMVKIALRKLFAGILCGCVVLLVLVAKWVREKKPSKPIHILTALFTTRVHKENKQVLPYQPTSGKLWPT